MKFLAAAALLFFPLADPVKVETFVSHTKVAPGGEFHIAARLTMEKPWHVQSHRTQKPYIATGWKIADSAGLHVGPMRFPEPEEFLFGEEPYQETLSVFGGSIVFGATVKVPADAVVGKRVIQGELIYQACDDDTCQLPKTIKTSLEIEIASSASAAEQHPEIFAALSKLQDSSAKPSAPQGGGTSSGEKKGNLGKEIEERGLLLSLLGIFLLGLGLNLTPCVYPVIAVTLGFFSRQAGGGGRVTLPLLYGLGIALTFTALGVVTALTGGLFGTWMQSAWVQLGLAALIFVFALSSFGLFEIQAPSWLLNRVGGGKTGGAGAFLMGLTMGVTAAPCVGPFIISLLLYIAQEQSVAKGLLWFGTLSLGLALPYPVLGFFSTSLQGLPKAGDWTEWVKRLMGLLLVAVSIFFLSSVLFPHHLLAALGALCLVGGLYIALLEKTGRQGNKMWFVRGAFFVLSLFGAASLFGQYRAKEIVWTPYQESLIEQAKSDGKRVVIDFSASWCNPCRLLEATTFRDPNVIAATEPMLRLRVDLSDRTDAVAESAYKKFDLSGLPTIIFLGPDGNEIPGSRIADYVNAEDFLAHLRK